MDKGSRKDKNEYPDIPIPAVGIAVTNKSNKFLMIKRGKPPAEDYWSVPGGSIELGETVFDAAKREVQEETGIICEPSKVIDAIDAIYKDEKGQIKYHYVIVYVHAIYLSGKVKAMDDATEAGWFTIDEIKNLKTPGRTYRILKGLLDKISQEF